MSRTTSSLSSLSCITRLSEDAPSVAINEAITLAAAHQAHLMVTIIAAKATVPFSPIGAGYVGPLVTELNERAKAAGAAVDEATREKLRKSGVNGTVRVILDHVDVVAEDAVRLARASDVIIVDQPSALLDTKGLILEEALFRSGRPVLVATPKTAIAPYPKSVVIGWDGSAHAARAVGDALALFPSIETAEIVAVKGEKDLATALPGADLAQYLAQKGVATTLTELTLKGSTVGAVLDGHASRVGANLIVMGGFGHSRLREFLFGGVTVELTESATIPLLMAY